MRNRNTVRNVLRLIAVGSTTLLLAACYGAIDPHPYDAFDAEDELAGQDATGRDRSQEEPLEGLSLADPGPTDPGDPQADPVATGSPLDAE